MRGWVGGGASGGLGRRAEVMRMAVDGFDGTDAAKKWRTAPNRTFKNTEPIDYLETEPGAMTVRQVLYAIASGGAV